MYTAAYGGIDGGEIGAIEFEQQERNIHSFTDYNAPYITSVVYTFLCLSIMLHISNPH